MTNFLKNLLCLIFHNWEICALSNYKGDLVGFSRECLRCGKTQMLERPKEYHPCKYIWVDCNLTMEGQERKRKEEYAKNKTLKKISPLRKRRMEG